MGAFPAAVIMGFMNYFKFGGYASRSEFWYWILFRFALSALVGIIEYFVLNVPQDQTGPLTTVLTVALFLPTLTVEIRRLRDAGYGFLSILWIFVPVIGWIILLYRLLQPTQHLAHSVYGYGN